LGTGRGSSPFDKERFIAHSLPLKQVHMRAYILHLVYRIGGEIPGTQDEDSGAGLGGSIELARGSRYMAGMGHVYTCRCKWWRTAHSASCDEADSPHRTQELLHHQWITARSLYKRAWLFVHGELIGSATSAVPIAQLQVILKEAHRRLNLKPASRGSQRSNGEGLQRNVRRDWRPGSAAHAKGCEGVRFTAETHLADWFRNTGKTSAKRWCRCWSPSTCIRA
jgi:hypothetical protein